MVRELDDSYDRAIVVRRRTNLPYDILIDGVLIEGEELSAHIVNEADGVEISEVEVIYTWFRDGVEISGAEYSTYVLTQEDVGRHISVVADFYDEQDILRKVSSDPDSQQAFYINLSGVAGGNSSAQIRFAADVPDGEAAMQFKYGSGGWEYVITTAAQEWNDSGLDHIKLAEKILSLVPEGLNPAFVPAMELYSRFVALFPRGLIVELFDRVANVNNAVQGAPAISGLAREGERLNASVTSISDLDGVGDIIYQWYRNGSEISGETSDSYLLNEIDVGARISVKISFIDSFGSFEVTNSQETTNVDLGVKLTRSGSFTLPDNGYTLDLLLTGSAAINGVGNSLSNRIIGNSGDNVLNGGLGADTLIGAAGDDTYVVDDLGDVVSDGIDGSGIDIVRSSISFVLSGDLENLELTGTFAINGTGNAIGNSITGNSAANIINGGAGVDTMSGGAGNDIYTVDTRGDRVIEMAEGGFDIVRSSATYTLGAKVENLELTGVNAINATGNALSNRITGNTAANVLNGGLGTDTMVGGAGNDTYVVDNAGDRVIEVAGGGSDLVRSSVSFVLGTDFESLQLTGSIVANGVGNSLENRLVGNAATNALDGRGGNDTIIGGGGSDAVIGGTGNDSISGDAGNDTLSGQNGIDVLTGGAGADVLGGGAGNDLLNGGSGRDKLSGDTGSDTLIGGGELDVFVFAGKFGADVITDFRNGADVIDLSGRGLSFADLKIRTVGDDTVIVLDTGRIVLEDFSAGTLRSGMFDLV